MAIGMRTNNLDKPVNLNSNKKRLRLTDKINQIICSHSSFSFIDPNKSKNSSSTIRRRDVKNVFSNSDGTIKGVVQLNKSSKVNVVFNVKLNVWVYKD